MTAVELVRQAATVAAIAILVSSGFVAGSVLLGRSRSPPSPRRLSPVPLVRGAGAACSLDSRDRLAAGAGADRPVCRRERRGRGLHLPGRRLALARHPQSSRPGTSGRRSASSSCFRRCLASSSRALFRSLPARHETTTPGSPMRFSGSGRFCVAWRGIRPVHGRRRRVGHRRRRWGRVRPLGRRAQIQSVALLASFLLAVTGFALLSLAFYREILVANAVAFLVSIGADTRASAGVRRRRARPSRRCSARRARRQLRAQPVPRRSDLRFSLGIVPRVVLRSSGARGPPHAGPVRSR